MSPDWPQRSFEGLLTAVYQYQIRDGWTVQTELSVHHPSGRRGDSSVRSFSRPAAQECRRFRTEDHAEVRATQIDERVATIRRRVRNACFNARSLIYQANLSMYGVRLAPGKVLRRAAGTFLRTCSFSFHLDAFL